MLIEHCTKGEELIKTLKKEEKCVLESFLFVVLICGEFIRNFLSENVFVLTMRERRVVTRRTSQ